MTDANHRQVLVAGAGPVGLTAALALCALGLRPTVLEAEPADRGRPGSRAIFVHRESLRLLERMCPGLGHELAAEGLVWQTKRTLWRGRQVYRRGYPPQRRGTLPAFTSLPQVRTEQVLLDACKSAGVEFAWDAAVTGVRTESGGVTVTTGERTWTAEYLIGADGSRSAVRPAIGAAMAGSRSDAWYVVVDVEEDPVDPLPVERVFHYEHPAVGHRNVLLVPFAGGWRIDLQCKDSDDPQRWSDPDGVRDWLPAVLPARYADRVRWVSTYRFLQVVADEFTDEHRRVLLAGEAAHLFAPFGARGMNSGIADADAAASAIRLALSATRTERARGAVQDFATARRAAAEYNRDAAGAALAHLRPNGPLAHAKRRLAARLAPRVTRAGSWLEHAPYGPRTGAPTNATGKY